MVKTALEVNIAESYREVAIDPKYSIMQEVMSKYYGLTEGLNTFLKELSHPFKNWQFIVREARGYSLDYFHLLKNHEKGPGAAKLFVEIFSTAVVLAKDPEIKADAVDNLLLFLQKIIQDSGTDTERFMPVLNHSFDLIRNYEDEYFFLFVKSYYRIKKLAESLARNYPPSIPGIESPIAMLSVKYFKRSYEYWLSEEDPYTWFINETSGNGADPSSSQAAVSEIRKIFKDISHEQIAAWKCRLEETGLDNSIKSDEIIQVLAELPEYNQLVEMYREIPQKLLTAGKDGHGNQWKLFFLFHIMNVSGLSVIHEETLREINRVLTWLMSNEQDVNIRRLIRKTFSILKTRAQRFPVTALNCVLNMGKGVYKTDEIDLVNFFIDAVVNLGFQPPDIGGVGNDWQIKVNSVHIQNIRTWMEIIELNPKWSTRLLSALIIHLSLCGVFIKDTDIFPRDITQLLNSDIRPVYNLVKQLARIFPAYFNDIGAEGELRDISTRLDEISHRKDILIHFLRKQSHVESSNRIIGFMEATLGFWETKDKTLLEPFVPPSIYSRIETQGCYVDGVNKIMLHLRAGGISLPEELLALQLEDGLRPLPADASEYDTERVELAISLYKILYRKYNLVLGFESGTEIDHYLSQLKSEAFPDLKKLCDALNERDIKRKIFKLLEYLELLKNLILSDESYEIREDIYKKRHFTVDIPSMYGSYHEIKFDALGLTFRIETLLNILFEELIENIDLSLITKATFYQIYARLRLFDKALRLDGISSVEVDRQLNLLAHSLEVRGFSFTQYIDIFKGFAQAVNNIINDYFNNIHEANLARILSQVPANQILLKYLPQDGQKTAENYQPRVSEIFSREMIAMSLSLQQLDRFLTRILNTLYQQSDKLSGDNLRDILLYDPHSTIISINDSDSRVSEIIYLGNKGFNLVQLKGFNMQVPPGFIITTEAFRFRELIESYTPAEQNFREQIERHISAIEKQTGKIFGDSENPLIFSVRSGSSISQPGMMDTFLDVGINEKIAAGMAERTGNPWFAWDNFRRFLQCYGMSFGLERDVFDAVIGEFKDRFGVPFKRDFTGDQMRELALAYKAAIQDSGFGIIENPLEQLHTTIKRVFNSWNSPKARTYRKIMGISDDWGTAVTVQSMVYGNLSRLSGTGVFFTHNPRWPGDVLRLWGDFTIGNQGEDVVSGLVNTLPISLIQRDIEMRDTEITLETQFPEVYRALKSMASELIYKKGWSPQEMEFTFESPSVNDLYLLQTRDMAIRKRKKVLTFDFDEMAASNFLGHGIGVSGGAMSGRVVFDLEEIDKWRVAEPKTSLILLRRDTVPDDIREIYAADGILTARGGVTSHAAVVAHKLDKTCIVGCGSLVCKEWKKSAVFGDVVLKSGDFISVDGREGSVYKGFMKIREK
ncbi:MAG: pyruvate, phosphate dikinase [Desulfobacteraceae bacterium]|nr:pyruvate, phosphate dikinase [Desulfobacteraceae bacterium]